MKNEDKLYLFAEPKNLSAEWLEKNHIVNTIFSKIKEGDYLYLEMPAFCSGEYKSKIEKDEIGFYINKKDFHGCYGYKLTL